MDGKAKKPALGLILAIGKKKPSGGGGAYDAAKDPSPECVKAVQHFFEAGDDGDFTTAAKALATALDHFGVERDDSGSDDSDDSEPAGSDEEEE
jgi:hypothetical protein